MSIVYLLFIQVQSTLCTTCMKLSTHCNENQEKNTTKKVTSNLFYIHIEEHIIDL